jgi:hydrophobic/amphiphilic exporter-1 (mainly G- bacteria), HAE1 family
VVDGFAEREELARYNGREAVGLLVFKEAGANTVQVARLVEEVLELLREEFPEVSLDVASSQAGFIRTPSTTWCRPWSWGGSWPSWSSSSS